MKLRIDWIGEILIFQILYYISGIHLRLKLNLSLTIAQLRCICHKDRENIVTMGSRLFMERHTLKNGNLNYSNFLSMMSWLLKKNKAGNDERGLTKTILEIIYRIDYQERLQLRSLSVKFYKKDKCGLDNEHGKYIDGNNTSENSRKKELYTIVRNNFQINWSLVTSYLFRNDKEMINKLSFRYGKITTVPRKFVHVPY